MPDPFLTDLRDRLVARGITATIHLGRLEDTPDEAITIRDYHAGPSKDLTGDELPVFEALAAQVLIRGARSGGIAAANTLATNAYRALVGRHVTINARRYDWIRADGPPTTLGTDHLDRPLISFDVDAQRWGDVTT